MKIDKTVKKETGYIVIGQAILLALMMAVYLVISRFTWQVLGGAVAGCVLAVGNFFLMGIAVQHSLESPEEDRVRIIRASQTARLMFIALIVVICLAVPKLDPLATVVPLFFPRLTIVIRQFMLNKSEK